MYIQPMDTKVSVTTSAVSNIGIAFLPVSRTKVILKNLRNQKWRLKLRPYYRLVHRRAMLRVNIQSTAFK